MSFNILTTDFKNFTNLQSLFTHLSPKIFAKVIKINEKHAIFPLTIFCYFNCYSRWYFFPQKHPQNTLKSPKTHLFVPFHAFASKSPTKRPALPTIRPLFIPLFPLFLCQMGFFVQTPSPTPHTTSSHLLWAKRQERCSQFSVGIKNNLALGQKSI